MTDEAATITDATEADAETFEGSPEEEAPAGHYFAKVKGHRVLVKELSAGQSIVLGGMMRDMRGNSISSDMTLDTLGKMMALLKSLLPVKADQDYLEDGIIDESIKLEDFAFIFVSAPKPAASGPAKKPRRGSGR